MLRDYIFPALFVIGSWCVMWLECKMLMIVGGM